MVQSATDYGQHMPAIAGLTAVTCGLLVCLGRYAKTAVGLEHEHAKRAVSRGEESLATDELPAPARRPRRGWVAFPAALGRLVLPSALMAGMAWAIVSVNAARIADGHWQRAQSLAGTLEADGWEGSNEDFTSLLMDTDAATQRQPGNVLYKYWLNAYRWRAISRVTDPDTGALVLTDRSIEHAARIVRELHAARPLCPTYGPVLCLTGQLELLLLDKPQEGAGHVRLGRELSPNDPSAVFAAALVDVNEKQWDASLEKFRHCLALNSNTITDVLASYIGADRPELGLAVSDGNAFWLLKLVVALRGDDKHADVTAQARDNFLALMAGEDQQNQATGWMLFEAGNLYRDRGDSDSAIAYYEKAVAKDYGQVPWRFELAKCLAASGKTSAAMREARLCLRLRPQWPAAKKFIEQLSLRPASFVAAAKTGLATQPGATTQPDAATQPAPATQPEAATQPAPVTEPGAAGAGTVRESAPAGPAERVTD
jgi:tetratricopeptide (TPR) repeat protein